MNYYTFYEEFTDKKKTKSAGNCLAVFGDYYSFQGLVLKECISAVFFHSNSACCGSSVSRDFLREKCKRVHQDKAKKIHPRLFEYLKD